MLVVSLDLASIEGLKHCRRCKRAVLRALGVLAMLYNK